MNGGVEVLTRARRELPRLPDITKALDMLEKLAARCASPGVEISVDLAELGGFNYESGLVFAAFTPGSPDAMSATVRVASSASGKFSTSDHSGPR